MKYALSKNLAEKAKIIDKKFSHIPLLRAVFRVIDRIVVFRKQVRGFYFEVILSIHRCPACGGRLHMTGQSECSCSCGKILDPTLTFQKSNCCDAGLVRKTFHYACSRCHKIVPSRFLFDERIFDKAYFREMMQESRKMAKKKRVEIRRLLAESRSGTLTLTKDPQLESIPSFFQDLNDFIQTGSAEMAQLSNNIKPEFRIKDYRKHIQSILSWDAVLFSDITPLNEDCRMDKIWRFITLIFMENDHEVELTQYGSNILVQRAYNEAYS